MPAASSTPTLPPEERQVLQQLVDNVGEVRALAIVNVSREALARALAGLPVRRGTLSLVRSGLAAHAAASTTAA